MLRSIKGSCLSYLALAAVAGVAFLFSGDALAQQDIAQMTGTVRTQVDALKNLAVAVFFLIGFVLFGVGLWLFWKDSKESGRGHAKNGLIAVCVGAALLLITTLVGVAANSMLGGGGADQIQQGFGNGNF
ncbi:hypothetical protein J2T57_001380 [Natronocella acetinitrilica]|uniref:TrbC/VIRB2 family protein n=1 Tax=Natronocella acetinitrilica TaxID=414046 RepID=A0AAE3G4K6_9GAMM|nr:DUF6750 family protein [Natronocella acetinitrilica]MCP1674278.1 hypothetical protein [Natronocella acetinitrilica]